MHPNRNNKLTYGKKDDDDAFIHKKLRDECDDPKTNDAMLFN